MNLKQVIQAILLIWFLAVSVAILVPSYQLLFGPDDSASASRPEPPAPPQPPPPLTTAFSLNPSLDAAKQAQQLEGYKQQVAAYAEQIKGYTQEVAAYTQQASAYKTHQEANEKSSRRSIYEVVVKGSLITLVASFITALVGFAFVNVGASLVNNMIRVRNNLQPEPLKAL